MKMELREYSYTENGRKLCFRVNQCLSFMSSTGEPVKMVIHSIVNEKIKNGERTVIKVRQERGNEAVVWKEISSREDGSLTIKVFDYEKELKRDE